MPALGTYFSTWIQGMLCIICIYHLSTYFFTKDKDFLLYALFIFLITLFTFNFVDNTISKLVYSKFKLFFDASFWILQVSFWVVAGWFYLGFLNLKTITPKVGKIVHNYINIIYLINIVAFIIDYFFFNQKYYAYFDLLFFVTPSFFIVLWVSYKMSTKKNPTIRFFELANFILIFAQTHLMLFLLFPQYNINLGINPYTLFSIGIFINIVVISVGLGCKYQLIKIDRDKLNLQIISELKRNEKLKNERERFLSEKIEEATLELEIAANEARNSKIAKLETELKNELEQLTFSSLLSYMNPHFLFNSLNAIKLFIIENKQKEAAFYLTKFSKLIRKMLDASTTKSLTLTEELETISLYTSIENIRFDNEIQFSFNVHSTIGSTDNIIVPPLILHPFIENAIWHGVSSKKTTKKITVSIYKENAFIIYTIKDNGIGRENAALIETNKRIKRTSFGIKATKARLQNFYANHLHSYVLNFTDLKDDFNNGIGTLVTLKLPIE